MNKKITALAAIMTFAQPLFPTLPDRLKPQPNVVVAWPPVISAGGDAGRGMGFMYATHYARIILK
jgi:hypothetical protein